jgi:hypothetical protein
MKKFLTAFASLASAFASNATLSQTSVMATAALNDAAHTRSPLVNDHNEKFAVLNEVGDQFNFILKKSADTGLLMAYHSSHSSHSSHRSHYSSR